MDPVTEDCPHGQQRRTCETCELVAVRDRLRADLVQEREEHRITWADWKQQREQTEAAKAERDGLRAVADAAIGAIERANDAADAAAKAVGSMGEKLTAVMAEQDRLRDERDMFRDQALPEAAMVLGALSVTLEDVEAERDRLRAVVAEFQRTDAAMEGATPDLVPRLMDEWNAAEAALLALDVSVEATDG